MCQRQAGQFFPIAYPTREGGMVLELGARMCVYGYAVCEPHTHEENSVDSSWLSSFALMLGGARDVCRHLDRSRSVRLRVVCVPRSRVCAAC